MAGKSKAGDVPDVRNETLGQIAYEAYIEAGVQDAGFSSVSGVRLPDWPDAEGRIQARWEAAANAVAAHVAANPPPDGS
jgi:hypothetical protein